jgi:hypothetical protein
MVYEVDVQQAAFVQLVRQVSVVRLNFRIERHVVERAEGRDPDTDLLLADGLEDGIRHLENKSRALLDGSTVAIRADVGVRPDELLQQVAVGAVQFDPIATRGDGISRGEVPSLTMSPTEAR